MWLFSKQIFYIPHNRRTKGEVSAVSLIVHLSKESFFSIVLAAIEAGKYECCGILYGRKRGERRIDVDFACALQMPVTRTSGCFYESPPADARISALQECAPRAYRYLGNFHSHPKWFKYEAHTPKLSRSDAKNILENKARIEILVDIGQARGGCPWQMRQSGSIAGRVANWRLVMYAYRVFPYHDVFISEQLPLRVSRSALAMLRRPK